MSNTKWTQQDIFIYTCINNRRRGHEFEREWKKHLLGVGGEREL